MESDIRGDKILILGTSNPQLDAIRYCQKKGLTVHACGHKRIGKGVDAADRFDLIDIKNEDEVLRYCEMNDIDYVYSVGVEVAVPTANHVSKKLGLPYFIEPENTDLSKDKTVWRRRLGIDFSGNVKFRGMKSKEELSSWDRYPAIMKPSDGQGQRGVRLVAGREEAMAYFSEVAKFSSTGKMMIEEYVSGPELSINAFVIDGEIVHFQETDRISFDEYPGGIIKEHHIPSKYLSKEEKLRRETFDMVQEAVDKLSMDNGPVYVQLKLEEEKRPKLIEITPRLDGCHLWRLIKYHSGADILDATFRSLFGQKEKAEEALRENDKRGRFKLEFMMEKPDKTVDKEKYDLDDPSYIEWYYDQGDEIREVNGFIEKIGYRIIIV